MIRVQVTAPFVEETREFKDSGRGIPTYLRRLKRLQKLHIRQDAEKKLTRIDSVGNKLLTCSEWQIQREMERFADKHGIKIQITHV